MWQQVTISEPSVHFDADGFACGHGEFGQVRGSWVRLPDMRVSASATLNVYLAVEVRFVARGNVLQHVVGVKGQEHSLSDR